MSVPPTFHAFPRLCLVAEDIQLARGERTLLAHLSFRVDAGQALVLTGANGVGKTTLLRAIAGFVPLASGRITFRPSEPGLGPSAVAQEASENDDDAQAIGQRCHVVGHLDGSKAVLTVAENLAFWATFLAGGEMPTSASADECVEAAMAQFKLTALSDIPAAYLSAGQKRRLGLARLCVAPRPLWLLDEPSVSLDADSVELLRRAIAAHRVAGGLVVAATHVDLRLEAARSLRLAPPDSLTSSQPPFRTEGEGA